MSLLSPGHALGHINVGFAEAVRVRGHADDHEARLLMIRIAQTFVEGGNALALRRLCSQPPGEVLEFNRKARRPSLEYQLYTEVLNGR